MEGPGVGRLGGRCQGPSGINAEVKRNRLIHKKLTSTPLEGPRGGESSSGTIRDQRLGQKKPFTPKQFFDLGGLNEGGGSYLFLNMEIKELE